ncbi:MAG: class I SAM-dependent methyltransferase [Ruminococcaceae bacterium]|nr:class I SAM-dependent methyltransferase [Oscillospiraceae bacterium]
MNSYDALAKVYDRLNREVDYVAIADFYEKVFLCYGARPALVLDLGCGTGSMTLELARRGYDMIGVDASAEMLAKAYERMWSEGRSGILFLEQDMREFELYGTVGAVVSTLDCVNYLTGNGDLDRCFSLVHNYLDPDGLFVFDVNTPYKFQHVYGDNAYILEEEDGSIYCGWQNDFDKESGICRFLLSVFAEEKDGHYARADEEQTERCYSREELTLALKKAGFCDIAFYGDLSLGAPGDNTERWYIAARCKKD